VRGEVTLYCEDSDFQSSSESSGKYGSIAAIRRKKNRWAENRIDLAKLGAAVLRPYMISPS
jgi:hypothetical protein